MSHITQVPEVGDWVIASASMLHNYGIYGERLKVNSLDCSEGWVLVSVPETGKYAATFMRGST